MATFVLVHGAWHGGWCWRDVTRLLQQAGHRVATPTCTGLGERAHLMSRDITLDTFVADVAGVIAAEELDDIVLVGHSFGGLAASGVADRMPERIRALVFLDALLVPPGATPFDALPPEIVAARVAAAEASSAGVSLPAPPPAAFGVTDPAAGEWLARRLTPHPFGTFTSPLTLRNPVGHGHACIYIECTDPVYSPLDPVKRWARQQPGWRWEALAASHDPMVTAPDALARLLGTLAI
ncbi:MAG: alpha/beta fold hydrolase [Acetobacteraceae bacterium]